MDENDTAEATPVTISYYPDDGMPVNSEYRRTANLPEAKIGELLAWLDANEEY